MTVRVAYRKMARATQGSLVLEVVAEVRREGALMIPSEVFASPDATLGDCSDNTTVTTLTEEALNELDRHTKEGRRRDKDVSTGGACSTHTDPFGVVTIEYVSPEPKCGAVADNSLDGRAEGPSAPKEGSNTNSGERAVDTTACEKAADAIEDACNGGIAIGTNKEVIYKILENKTACELREIDLIFRKKYGKNYGKAGD